MRHPTWDHLIALVDRITDRFGGVIHDSRCAKRWDAGQAVCAEAYGPDWMHNPDFLDTDARPEGEPCPIEMLAAATRLLRGECAWTQEAGT